MKAQLVLVLALVASTFAALTPAQAANGGVGVTPVELSFAAPLLRGNSYTGELRLQNAFEETVTISASPLGDVAPWVHVEPTGLFTIAPGTTRTLLAVITVPADAANGDYLGALALRVKRADLSDGSGASVDMELKPAIRVKVDGSEVRAFALEDARVADAEEGTPPSVIVKVVNRGNVRAVPSFKVVVRDATGALVREDALTATPVAPGGGESLTIPLASALSAGEYEATVALAKDGPTTALDAGAFKVVAAGALAASDGKAGTLTGLGADGKPAVGSILRIAAVFKNTGVRGADAAKLTAEILLEGERVAVVTSDPVVVPAGQTAEITAFWTPEKPGAYVLKGSITYDGLKTETREASLRVAGSANEPPRAPESGKGIPAPGLVIVAALALGVALAVRRR